MKNKNFNQHTLSKMLEKKIETQTENVVGGVPVISDDLSHPSSEDLLTAQATTGVNPQHFFT